MPNGTRYGSLVSAGCVLGGAKAETTAGCTRRYETVVCGAHDTKQLPCQGWRSRQETPDLAWEAWEALTPALAIGPEARPAPAAPASPTGEGLEP
jgi:hypothetical protein